MHALDFRLGEALDVPVQEPAATWRGSGLPLEAASSPLVHPSATLGEHRPEPAFMAARQSTRGDRLSGMPFERRVSACRTGGEGTVSFEEVF